MIDYKLLESIAYLNYNSPYTPSPIFIYWEPNMVGDCTEKTAWVREILYDLNIPSKRWICKTEHGKKHAVAIIKEGRDEWVIDCRYPKPIKKEILMYTDWACLDE